MVGLIYFISFMSPLRIHIIFTVIHRKHFVTMISLMLVIIIVTYLHSYFVRFVNAALPYILRLGMLFAMGHSSFLRSIKMARWTRKHGLTCLEYMVRIVNQTARIAMKSCQDYVKLFSASTGYKRSPGQLRMCVYFPISCEVGSMYRKLTLRLWNPSSAGTPCLV